MTVTPLAGDNTQEVGVGGVVPGVLSLEITGSANFGAFEPAVTKDYFASLSARATSSATAAELTVRDPSSQSTGHLVNGGRALAQAVQVRAGGAELGVRAGARERVASAAAGVPGAVQRGAVHDRLQAVDQRHRAAA